MFLKKIKKINVLSLQGSCENIPAGYEAVSLIEALNGPYTPRMASIPVEALDTPDATTANAIQAAEVLNRWQLKKKTNWKIFNLWKNAVYRSNFISNELNTNILQIFGTIADLETNVKGLGRVSSNQRDALR